jgi:holo-[acyl-carrier protein] synthase
MSVLVGIDIQPIDEVEASLRTFGARYRTLLFTDHELESCANHFGTASGLAARFAAKEAVLKILDIRGTVPSWRSIEVRRTASGRPEILLHDAAADLARQQGVENIAVSLSHTDAFAIATVVATISFDPGQSRP